MPIKQTRDGAACSPPHTRVNNNNRQLDEKVLLHLLFMLPVMKEQDRPSAKARKGEGEDFLFARFNLLIPESD